MILAIETSCDETSAAIVTADQPRVRANVISSQVDIHAVTGGVVPEVAARLQLEMIIPVIEQAFREAAVTWDDIDRIAVTSGPGLNGPLLVGVETAKALGYARGLSVVGVNHLAGHLYACLHDTTDYDFPYLGLVVSGSHTELVEMHGHHDFRHLGSTRDDAAGEAFDKVGRLLGFGYPAGPAISEAAEHGNPEAIAFPRAMLDQDNLDFSFSGLKTAARREIEREPLNQTRIADLSASFQAAVVDVLVGKTLRAAATTKPTAILLGGGVAANKLLRAELTTAAEIPTLVTPPSLATDNAGMIGLAALYLPNADETQTLTVDPNLSLAPTSR